MSEHLSEISRKHLLWGALAVLAMAGLFILLLQTDLMETVTEFLDKQVPDYLFAGAMFILPAFGVPISIFLVLAGVKFGFVFGFLIMLASFPIHMTISFMLVRSVFKDRLATLLEKRGYQLPEVPERRTGWFTILFVGMPGIPYAPKNYVLALVGIPFAQYLGLGVVVNVVLGTPFVLLGVSASDNNILVSLGAVAAVGLAYFLFLKFKIYFQNGEK